MGLILQCSQAVPVFVSQALCLDLCVPADGGLSNSHALTCGNGFGELFLLWRQWSCVRAACRARLSMLPTIYSTLGLSLLGLSVPSVENGVLGPHPV